MDSHKLSIRQLEQLNEIITRQLRFLGRLLRRMEQLGFPPDDLLYRTSLNAYDGVHRLRVHCHYLCVDRKKQELDPKSAAQNPPE